MKITEKTVLKVFGLIALVSLLLIICAPSYGQSTQVRSLSIVEPTPTPISVRANPSGTGGQRTYFYWVVANYFAGSSVPFGPAQVRAANPLTGTNGVSVSWDASPDAISYDVLRADTNQSPVANGPCGACAVATGVVVTTVNDIGGALVGYTLPAQIPVGQALGSFTNTTATPPRLNWTTNGPYTFRMDRNTWTIVGVDTLANIPAQCVGEHDAYVCSGVGCVGPTLTELFYCKTDNNWVSLGGGGSSSTFWNVVNVGPIVNLPATCTVNQDVYICTGAGCKGNTQIELAIYYCTAPNTFTSFSQGVEFWFKYNIPETALTAAATTESIPLFNTDDNTSICGLRVKQGTAFTGGGLTAMTVSVGVSGEEGLFSQPFDIFQAPGNQVFLTVNVQDGGQVGFPTSVLATFDSVGANVNAATAGDVSIWVCSVDLPGGLP